MKALLLLFVSIVNGKVCYWNNLPYSLYGTKTPYDTIRGDIRDHQLLEGCEPISIWRINRHGNRNPNSHIVKVMKKVMKLKNEIIATYEAGNSGLCAQDIENLRKWSWSTAIDDGHAYLTNTGYDELYHLGKRLAQRYRNLLQGTPDQFYFRPTNEQRTITSCAAFVHGITDQVPLNVTIEDPWSDDPVIRPYETCERYDEEVKQGRILIEQEDQFLKSREYIDVQRGVQSRLGIQTALDADGVLAFYQLCRYYRAWTPDLRCPWCAVFSNEDLIVMEYFDDVSHYYKKGYGSWVNVHLGQAPLKNLYEAFEEAVSGKGKKLISYFTHDTMMEMMYSAMGIYFDGYPIEGAVRKPARRWRSSFFGAFSSNLMAILNRCRLSSTIGYRVQFFINELETTICPTDGCPWQKFQEKFQIFTKSNLSFCDMKEEVKHRDKTSIFVL